MFLPHFRSAVIVALAATPAFAQGFLPIGNQIMDGSQNLVTVNLGFNFTMPGGNVVTAVDVDETGRILEVGTDPTDASETTSEMLAIPGGQIMACWDTITYVAGDNSSVWFDTDNASVATVTWVNVNTTTDTTFQVQMYATGEIIMCYDSRTPVDDGIIGVCPGNGAVLPAPTDLSSSIGAPIIGTDPTVFEDFDFSAPNAVDWVSTAFIYSPNSPGGATGWTLTGIPGIADPITPFSDVTDLGDAGCPSQLPTDPVSWTFAPDGLGNYDITKGPSQFDPNLGANSGISSSSTLLSVFLSFPFTWPDGTTESVVQIDSNGRLLPGTSSDSSDLSPSILEHILDGNTSICPFWTDINVTEPSGGGIFINQVAGTSATFTWDAVKQNSTLDDPLQPTLTFQVTIYSDNSFVITHEDIEGFNDATIGSSADDLLVGCGSGVLPAPVELDLSDITTINVPSGNNFEFWDSSGTNPVEPTDLINFINYGELVSLSDPIINTTWSMQIQGSGASVFGFYLVGFAQTSFDLSIFGTPCNLLVDSPEPFTTFTTGLGDMTQWDLPLPNDPNLFGVQLFCQGAIEGAPNPPFSGFVGLPFTFSLTNALQVTVGGV